MLQVQFASKKRRANLALVLALWHELMVEWHPASEPMHTPMPRRSSNDTLSTYLMSAAWPDITREQAERACGFDIVLRLASGLIDSRHSTHEFFTRADNGKWFRPVDMPGTTRNRPIGGVELTPEAIAIWSGASDDERQQALGEARRLLESDLESQGIPVKLLPHEGGAPSLPAVPKPPATSRTGYLEALARDIQTQPFQPVYRKRAFGVPVTGWDARLRAYFWPAPAQGYRETAEGIRDIAQTARALAEALAERGTWDADEQQRAVELAHAIFAWGGVPQDPKTVTASTVEDVVRAALDNDAGAGAHMNSGWTKVAAFVTDHVDGRAAGRPQAIWDSRVATSIVARLDRLLPADMEPSTLFPGVGTVPGRGGTRPRALSRRWPSGYKTWAGQVAGSQVVRDIRDILNNGDFPKMPLPDGGAGTWTTRGVEMVLFMDGY